MTTWIICGAGSGVGKTRLALKLCDILPNCVYAKRGCGEPKPGKPANFFREMPELRAFVAECASSYDHVVVESNAMVHEGEGDVIIFVGPIPGQTDVRRDADDLEAKAHVRITPNASPGDWERFLRGTLPGEAQRRGVCRAFAEQKRYVSKPRAAVRSKVWFVSGDAHVFGSGLAHLLENVERHGTLRQAARAARISYRHAWDMINAAEKHLGKKLTVSQPGGAGGGRSRLSFEGRKLLNTFERLNQDVADFADERFAALSREELCDDEQDRGDNT